MDFITTLPTEIWMRILKEFLITDLFHDVCPHISGSYGRKYLQSTKTIFYLSHCCFLWRDITFLFRPYWPAFCASCISPHVLAYLLDDSRPWNNAETVLHFALHLDNATNLPAVSTLKTIELLAKHASKWGSFLVDMEPVMPYEADLDSETVLFPEPIIEVLDSTLYASYEKAINLCEISINLDCVELESITASSIFSAVSKVRSLTKFRFRCRQTILLENANIPWKKLDILELHISMSRERAVNILRQCESATSVDIRRISGETEHTYGTKVTLKKLLKLTWGDSSDGGPFKSLESIRTPVLKVLRIKDVFEDEGWFSLANWDDKFEKYVETNLCAESLSKFTVSEEFPDSIQQPSTLMTALTMSGTGALPTFFIVLKDSPDLIYNMLRQNPEIGERLPKLTVWKKEGVADGYKVCIGWTVCNMPSSSKVVRIGDGFRENSNSTKKKWFNDYLKDVEALK